MTAQPLVVRGTVGWRNTADERTTSQLDVYGPRGRWAGAKRQGDTLIDALEAAGATEGARLIVVAVNRFGDDDAVVGRIRAAIGGQS